MKRIIGATVFVTAITYCYWKGILEPLIDIHFKEQQIKEFNMRIEKIKEKLEREIKES